MAFFGPHQPLIGNDILDLGSRKAEMRARRQRGLEELALGAPGQFDVPNVPDVSSVYTVYASSQELQYLKR